MKRFNPLKSVFNSATSNLFKDLDFHEPKGEEALYSPDSLAWQIYKNPVVAFIGGISAVIMQLSEPRVRTGIWEHSTFKNNAAGRMKRTGLSAMTNVFGPASKAQKMIERINSMHSHIHGTTECGKPYRANDPELLRWVQETLSHCMLSAYSTYIREPNVLELQDDYQTKKRVAELYGVKELSNDNNERLEYFKKMLPTLEDSPIIFEFINIIKSAHFLPSPLRPFQHMLVNAAVNNVPDEVRQVLGIDNKFALKTHECLIIKFSCAIGDRVILGAHPAVIACQRMGLPSNHLYRK